MRYRIEGWIGLDMMERWIDRRIDVKMTII